MQVKQHILDRLWSFSWLGVVYFRVCGESKHDNIKWLPSVAAGLGSKTK
jgi:hypothetical protein